MKLRKIESIKTKHYRGKVYDLTVQDNHSYNIGGIVVHNSVCETRIRTGVGVPQITALMNARYAVNAYEDLTGKRVAILADGGIRNPGDFAKALAIGADAVVLGSLLAGTKESPGELIRIGEFPNEQLFKQYRGAASFSAKLDRGENNHVEGNSTMVPYKGKVQRIIQGMTDGLRSSMSYLGANNLEEFRKRAEFIEVTQAGQIEAKPHILYK